MSASPAPAAPADASAPHERGEVVRGWYTALLAVNTPVLLLGFLYSALADRLIFAGWALVVAGAYTASLRQGFSWGWPRMRLAGVLALLLAAAFAWLMVIEREHHEILDLGFRAVFPDFYVPFATRPQSAGLLAAGLAVVGVVGLFVGRSRRSPETA